MKNNMTDENPNISCKKATVLMSKSMEEELSLKESASLLAHLALCKTCSFCFRQLKSIKKTIAHYSDVIFHLPPHNEHTLSDEAKERIKRHINEKES